MIRYSLRCGVATLALAGFVAAGATVLPYKLSDDFGLKAKVAEAKGDKGRGGGNGGGRGGGNGGGNGNGNGNGGNDTVDASDASLDAEDTEEVEDGKKNGWGSLSASNASTTALDHASANSRVGAIADYANATTDEEAAAALARASNKEITPERLGMVNANLGIEMSAEEEAALAALAEEARTNPPAEEEEVEGELEGETEEETTVGETEGEGTTEEETNEVASAAEDLIGGEEGSETETQ